ncbi:protein FREE1 isoform X1 [Punica granatum]|uniref:Protein FREE1 isoform X1 n=2 Tax=Punica granatum TaxID=22663 RepID=A0A6P8E062_PUNGR|nr:protein FREE1 isoform X1 [Punica granatum]
MQQGDYSSAPYYHPHYSSIPNPNPAPKHADHSPGPYASAPPFSTTGYSPADYGSYPSNYPPYPQNPDPVPPPAPTAPSYSSHPNPSPNLQPPTSFSPSLSQPPAPQAPSSFPGFESHGAYQPPAQQPPQSYYSSPAPSYDQPPPPQQVPPSYSAPISAAPNLNSNPISSMNPSSTNPPYSSMYPSSAPYNPPSHESPYHDSSKFDHGSSYIEDKYGNYGRSRSSLGSELYGKQSDSSLYDSGRDDLYGDGVYAYQGGKAEPYGARGTAPKSSTWSAFDDYGRSISFPSSKESSSVSSPKIVRAVPKAEAQQDVKSGVQKFRVKLLPESGSQTMDVLCQIGLDGIKMLDPSTGRMLRIYPLENITRCDVIDSSIFAFWSKSSVDIEPRRIRLQSSSYTTNTILDIVTAATVQLKEMGGRSRPSDTPKINEQQMEKKKGLADWMNLIKPGNEEKDHWVPDEAVTKCTACGTDFGAFVRRHHCRNCGDIFCDKCTHGRIALTADENAQPVRVCDRCLAEVTQRLSNAKEAASKPVGLQSHEDLAKKLQEEMERNRRAGSSSKSEGSGRRMREVACPICTVHLQVQVPSSGSETIECGVCQHPFLVSAH